MPAYLMPALRFNMPPSIKPYNIKGGKNRKKVQYMYFLAINNRVYDIG